MVYLQIQDATTATLVDGRNLAGPWQGYVNGVSDGPIFLMAGTVTVTASGITLESELLPLEHSILWPAVFFFFLAGLQFARSLR